MSLTTDPAQIDRSSTRLRTTTRAEHEAAQGSGFLDALAEGRLPRVAYADLAAQHWFGLNGAGHRFFVFAGVSPLAFSAHYRELLGAVSWSPPTRTRSSPRCRRRTGATSPSSRS
jgi:hypothetical protein